MMKNDLMNESHRKRPKKALFKGPKSAIKMFGLRMTPLFGTFSENSSDLVAYPVPKGCTSKVFLCDSFNKSFLMT